MLTFSDIKRILGFPLPPSASVHRPWWANDVSHSQAKAWLDAGWQVESVSLGQSVTFVKAGTSRDILTASTIKNAEADSNLSEDAVKNILRSFLEEQGWQKIQVAMGKEHGIDVDAHRNSERWIIEAKGCGSRNPMRVNYFLSVLGKMLQRMDDPSAKYSIALPAMKQYEGLWARLPTLAKSRTKITALFISKDGRVVEQG
ncbi:MAG: hypothetical protein MdMp014T_0300 [Treponematales bacterium]